MEKLTEGLIITFVGMAVVMAFLTLMIFVMNLVNGFIVNVLNKIFPEAVKEVKKPAKKAVAKKSDDEAVAVAIAAAAGAGGR